MTTQNAKCVYFIRIMFKELIMKFFFGLGLECLREKAKICFRIILEYFDVMSFFSINFVWGLYVRISKKFDYEGIKNPYLILHWVIHKWSVSFLWEFKNLKAAIYRLKKSFKYLVGGSTIQISLWCTLWRIPLRNLWIKSF